MIVLKSLREIEQMRTACKLVVEILEIISDHVQPGVTTWELERLAVDETSKRYAIPAFKGYQNFPNALCCSPNNQVVHGMPTKIPLKDGDILSIDFGIFFNGYYGDAALTLPVGNVSKEAQQLLEVTEASLYKGISSALPGGRLFDISSAIQTFVEHKGFSVVRDFVGHGIGRNLHEDPQVPNYGIHGKGIKLKPGMVLAIEPMINQGSFDVCVLDDGWTAVTCDGKLSAHFEHTVAITEKGPDILTRF